ncbi:27246_t:CDS:10 [Gigaspora margarita]|uniref:27246_t:CDS:1 n=1 Tax=Gigaspora margarita TaxID=4874 RepID=A0ABM8VVG5_GIGMA|nr:27246_t:CDS:10 [Gigaspora margarita]
MSENIESSSAEKKDLTNYLKHYGFLLPNAEIYGGLANAEEFTVFLEKEDKGNYSLKNNCRNCGKNDFHPPRQFNLLLTTNLEITEGKENIVYLRPETCQGIFTNFAAIQRSTHRQLPFGIGQIGKSFRNEITLHHGIFRTREFEQMELDNSHRGNYDLTQHSQHSQKDLSINGIIPQVIEVSFGVERLMLAILEDSYQKETIKNSRVEGNEREVLKLPPLLAPYFATIIPLSKEEKKTAHQLYLDLLPSVSFNLGYEEVPNIGKAYRRQDAIGTYYCLTVDAKTTQDNTITLRYRDTMEQIKLTADLNSLKNYLNKPEINYDYETALGAREVSPTAKDVSKLLSDNYSLEKTIRRNLASENRRKPIPTSLKKEVEKELDNNISRTNEIVSGFKLELLDPEHLSFIYSQLYEQGKEIKKQKEVTQPNWQIPYSEEQEINVEMNKIDLSKPLELAFKGYTGFLTPEQLKGSTEGTMTFGLTTTSPNSTFSSGEKGKKVPHGYDECTLAIKIDQKKGRTYYDISFGQVVETISHELAHAVINSIKGEYDGERQELPRTFPNLKLDDGSRKKMVVIINIAIDGPVGSGKTTIGREKIVSDLEKERQQLSAPEISDLASRLSPLPELRQVILDFQRELTQKKGWVVVGRDITSAVLPQAEVKVFLTASLTERARRRNNEYGIKLSSEEVKKELQARDERDKGRKISPLVKTADSWELDTTHLSPEESELDTTSAEIKNIIESITQEYGEGVITTLGASKLQAQKILSTGSLLLDQAIGTGGYVCGKIVEIFGLESSGKSTLALHAVRECQRAGKKAAYIDLENGLDIKYVRNIGVRSEDLIIAYPSSGEEGFEIMSKLIKADIDLIIVDSVSNLIPRSQLEANLEKHKIGLRRLKNELTNKEAIIIFINQIRNKINTGFYGGNPETTTGGMALNFDADLRIKLKRKDKIEKNNELIGIEVEAKIVKNKLATPGKTANLEIIFAQGIQKEREIIDLATELNKKLGQGKENVSEYLLENPELYQEIENNVLEYFLGIGQQSVLDENSIPGETIDLIITSPPYNVGIDYGSNEDNLTYEKYLNFSQTWLKNCYH